MRDHARSAKLGPALAAQGRIPDLFEGTEAFLRAAAAESPYREVRGLGCYWPGWKPVPQERLPPRGPKVGKQMKE